MAKNRKTNKKVTSFVDETTQPENSDQKFVPKPVNKRKSRSYRLLSIVFWILAIGFEILAILQLNKETIQTTWLIVFIVLDLLFVVTGSILWKKANRLDPASEKQKVRYFLQNQLGLIISIIAFLPLVILIFKNDKMDKKQKGIVGVIAIIALLIAGLIGVDFDPPSQEKYLEETQKVKSLTQGRDYVYWTKSGKSYHLFEDCSYINTDRTVEIFEGTVVQAKEMKKISDLCDRCQFRAEKNNKESLLE